MNNSARLFLAAGIIILIILLGFVLSIPHTKDLAEVPTTLTVATTTPVVALKDSFKKGTHIITGEIEAPNACTTVSVDVVPLQGTDASATESILVALSMPFDTGICLQKPTTIPFSGNIDAPASLPISVTVNGIEASTTPL